MFWQKKNFIPISQNLVFAEIQYENGKKFCDKSRFWHTLLKKFQIKLDDIKKVCMNIGFEWLLVSMYNIM